jgi:hypothetical protein
MPKLFRPIALILTVAFAGACSDSVTGVETFNDCPVRAYQIGSSVSGNLTADCPLPGSDTYVNYYAFTRSSSNTFTINMMSDVINPYLILYTADGTYIGFDDNSGSGWNARIIVSLPPGDYVLGATTGRSRDTGSYTLSSN